MIIDRRLVFCMDCQDNRLGVKTDTDTRHVCKVCGGDRTSNYRNVNEWQIIKARKDAEAARLRRAARKNGAG